jgi:glutamate racemase
MVDLRPIGFFDSGVGGLTVLREVLRRSPAESTVYLGDNLRAPYGPRTDDEVRRFSLECLDELAARDVKAIVVACNTATAVALPDLRRRHDVPILGVVRPGATAAALATRTRRVGVVATTATVRSHAYFQAIKDEDPFVEVYEHATPDLVPLVESGQLDGPEVEAAVARALAPLLGARDGRGEAIFPLPAAERIDTLLLACTHYPLLLPVISATVGTRGGSHRLGLGDRVRPVQPAGGNGLAAPAAAGRSHLQLTTGSVRAFRRMAERLFGELFPAVEAVVVRGAA